MRESERYSGRSLKAGTFVGGEVLMELKDNGIGMKEEVIEQVLDLSEKGIG
jgi:hypothetical protein